MVCYIEAAYPADVTRSQGMSLAKSPGMLYRVRECLIRSGNVISSRGMLYFFFFNAPTH